MDLIDSHAHLFYEDYANDLLEVLTRAHEQGVDRIVVPGTRADTSQRAIELAAQFPGIFAAIGIHPHEASKVDKQEIEVVRRLAEREGVVAVGEIGLDYFYDFAPKDAQVEIFQRQLDWASESNLPVIVHTRDSMDDSIRMVEHHARSHSSWGEHHGGHHRGVFHCFTGSAEQAQRLFDCGFYVSFPGIVTFKKHASPGIVRALGLDRVLIETDSPYLTPVPYRGKRNEPAHVALIANAIAGLLGVPAAQVAETTTRNAELLFRIPFRT